MAAEQKIVRGGFRATLALIVSIIAIILALIAYQRSGARPDLNAQIKDLQAKMERIKRETSEKLDKVRQESASALEKMSKAIRKEERSQ